jgi:Leucine-rich repeat (LRR) protein
MTDSQFTRSGVQAATVSSDAVSTVDSFKQIEFIDHGLHTLRSLAAELGPELSSLNLHSNHLTHIDLELCGCAGLKRLNLSSNDLTTLAGLEALSRLERLNAACNRLTRIDFSISALAALHHLNLSYNQIQTVEALATVAGHPLQTLHLQGNLLEGVGQAAHLRGFARLNAVTFSEDGADNPLCGQPTGLFLS